MRPLVSGGFTMVRYIGHPTLDLNSALIDEWAERVARRLRETALRIEERAVRVPPPAAPP